jgi:DNA-binding transcriptional LysR family regulator
MDIKTVRTLVAIADNRSFLAAAQSMGKSLSNVSLQVQALEKELDVQLFDRSSRPPRLTEAGSDFVLRSREMLVHWEILQTSVSGNSGQGQLKVGAVHTAVAGGVSVALGRMRKRHDGLFLQLHTALTTELIRQLQNQTIDCAIITETVNTVMGMRFLPVAREELGVIANQEARGENFREILESNPYLRFNRQATLAQLIDSELKNRGIRVDATMEITTLDAIESLVRNGLGVSVVPVGRTVRPLPRSIRRFSFSEPRFYRSLGLMVKEDCPRMHLVEILLEELRRAYAMTGNQ